MLSTRLQTAYPQLGPAAPLPSRPSPSGVNRGPSTVPECPFSIPSDTCLRRGHRRRAVPWILSHPRQVTAKKCVPRYLCGLGSDCTVVYAVETLRGLAEQFVDDGLFGDIPAGLQFYIDYDAIARDLGMDYAEMRIAGQRLI